MAILSTIVAFTLRQASIESGEQIVAKVRDWLTDPSLEMPRAIKTANDHTWHAVALALGGDGFFDRMRGVFAGSDVRSMRDQVKRFLRSANVGLEGVDGRFRRSCLEELQRLKKQGKLGFEAFDPAVISKRASDFRRFDDPTALAREARRAATVLAGEIAHEAPHLAELLRLPLAGDDRPLLVTAFSFFLRKEIAEKQEMTNGLVLDATERLHADQAGGFEALRAMMGSLDDRMHQIIEVMVGDVEGLVVLTGRTKEAIDDASSKVDLVLEMVREQQARIDAQRERDEQDRREMRSLIQLLLDTVNQRRQKEAYPARSPFAADAEQAERADRAAVEELLERSPLTSQARTMFADVLEDELRSRRTRPGLAAGARREGPAGMAMVWVPAGSFFMGSPTSEPCRDEDEFPHHVTLTHGFWIGAHPVTRRQWWQTMRSIPDDQPCDDRPVEGVSWEEASEFLDVLVEKSGFTLPLRLPTEAEWEYACRAGTVTPFAFGFRLSGSQANFNAAARDERLSAPPLERRAGTTPVGAFPPNAWGLYDMHGNVMEWCQDWYGEYELCEVEDPQGPAKGQSRVLRGGGWWSPVHACRSARRSSAQPTANALPAGFRVVMLER